MIIKPPEDHPRSCWNIYEGKPKKQYTTAAEATDVSSNKIGYDTYRCGHCRFYHIGRTSTTKNVNVPPRFPELELELGIRVTSHLFDQDTQQAINARCRSAVDKIFRRRS